MFYTKWNSVTVCSVARHPFICYSSFYRHIQKPILPSARKKEFKPTNFFVYTRGDHFGLVGAKRPDFFEDDFSEVLYVKRITRKQALEAERIDLNVVDNHSRSDSGTEDNDNDYNFVGTKYASDTEDEASEEKFK